MGRGRKTINIIIIAVFTAIVILPTVFWMMPGDPDSTGVEEKRLLEGFPAEINNGYLTQIESWYMDNAPYRSRIITEYTAASQKPDLAYRTTLRRAYKKYYTPSWYRNSNESESYCLPFIKKEVLYGRDDWLFFTGNNAIDYYAGNNVLSVSEMEAWKKTYQTLQKECDKRGIKLVVMVAPDKEQVYPEKMASIPFESDKSREGIFEEYMRDSGVAYLYPLREIKAAKENGETYFRQDSHWNNYGAYILDSRITTLAFGNRNITIAVPGEPATA